MDNFAFVDDLDKPQENTNTVGENEKNCVKIENTKLYTFDEAVSLTKVGIYHYFLEIVCGFCLMASVLDLLGSSIIIPFISQDIPATVAEIGLFASSAFLGSILSSHACGFLSDTWGRIKMLRTTVALSFITSLGSVFCVNIWMLTAFRFLAGLIISSCQAISYSYLSEFHGSSSRTKYVSMVSMFLPMGMMVIPALGLAILPLKLDWEITGMTFRSWRLFLLLCCLLRIIPLIGLFIMPESPKYSLIQGHHDDALNTLRTMFVTNTGKPKCDYPVQRMSGEISDGTLKNVSGVSDALKLIWVQTAQLFYKNTAQMINICFTMFSTFSISNGLYMWLPVILTAKYQVPDSDSYTTCEVMRLSYNIAVNATKSLLTNVTTTVDEIIEEDKVDTTMFLVMIIIGVIFTVTYSIFSSNINFLGERRLLFGWITISGAACLVILFVTDYTWSVVVFTIITSLNNCGGIVSAIAMDFFPTNVSAMGMCLVIMIARIGSFAGGNFIGFMIYAHCDMIFYIYSGLCALLLVLSYILPGSIKVPTKSNKTSNSV